MLATPGVEYNMGDGQEHEQKLEKVGTETFGKA